MSTLTRRALIACASVAPFVLFGPAAAAQLPLQSAVDLLGAERQDFLPDQFTGTRAGDAVAIRNGIAFFGIPGARRVGHVAVLNLTTNGWERVDTLQAPNDSGETRFGRSLTFRDGVLVVGGANAAYVFRRSNGIWTFRQKLPPQQNFTDFPVALRYEGGTLLATARRLHAGNVVVIYEMDSAGTFASTALVTGSLATAGEDFGVDISMNARSFVVAAPVGSRGPIFRPPAYDQTGSVYRFGRNSTGQWTRFQKLVPSEPAPGFGTSVALDNDMIIVGAPKVDIEGSFGGGVPVEDGHVAGGAAYVFRPVGPGGSYVQTGKLRPTIDQVFLYRDFGYRVAMFGTHIAIAATELNSPDRPGFGLVVNYLRDGANLFPRVKSTGHIAPASIGLANSWLVVGSPFDVLCTSDCLGSVSIYDVNRFAR